MDKRNKGELKGVMILIMIKTKMKKIPKRCQNCQCYGHQNNEGWSGDPCCLAMSSKKVKAKERPEWCPLVECVDPRTRKQAVVVKKIKGRNDIWTVEKCQ